jgi:hypothetical protein
MSQGLDVTLVLFLESFEKIRCDAIDSTTITTSYGMTDAEFIETLYYILQDHVQTFCKFSKDTLSIGSTMDSFYFDGYTLDNFKQHLCSIGFIPIDKQVFQFD